LSQPRKPRKLDVVGSVIPMAMVVSEWFRMRYYTEENRLCLDRHYDTNTTEVTFHAFPCPYVLFYIKGRYEKDGRMTEGRLGELRVYPNEVILHVEKKHAHMFDDTEAVFKKLQTA
jgi:hypothetical protein